MNFGLQLYMDAFFELCGDRGSNNRLQWLSMHAYARALGLSRDEERDMIYLLRQLDMAYCEWAAKGKQNGQPPGPKRRPEATG